MVSDKRLYLDKNGAVVTDGPAAVSLLVGQGCQIEEKELTSRGCTIEDGKVILPGTKKPVVARVNVEPIEPEEKVSVAPVENKAVTKVKNKSK